MRVCGTDRQRSGRYPRLPGRSSRAAPGTCEWRTCPLNSSYHAKNQGYFGSPRTDYVAALETNPAAAILELGCGNGDWGP